MQFKKAKATPNSNDINDFINQATGEVKTQKKEINKIQIKISKEMFAYFNKRTKNSILNKSQFLEFLYFQKNDYFTDAQMIKIFDKAIILNMGIRDYIRYKLNLTNKEDIKSKAHKTEHKHLVGAYISREKREEANLIAANANLSVQNYGYLKIIFAIETENLFSFDEIVAIKKEAEDKKLEVGEYITLKIQYE